MRTDVISPKLINRKDFVPLEKDAHGAWMSNEGKVAAFLPWFTDDPVAEAPLKLVIMLSSCKNLLRLVSKLFKSHAEEGTSSITWEGPDREEEGEEETKMPAPNSLFPILAVSINGCFKPAGRFPNLKSIDCDHLDTLMDLNGCPSGLKVLRCSDCRLIQSLAPLAICTNLRNLSIAGSKISNLKPLMGCVELVWLDISYTPVSDICPLSACIALKVLCMAGTDVSDLIPLSGHPLRFLDVGQTEISDLSPLSTFLHLESLLCHNTKVSDLMPLSKCSELKALSIWGTEVKSLAPLLQCKKLEDLYHGDVQGDQTEGYIRL